MKKILLAWIEQVIQFDNDGEYQEYIHKLQSGRPQKFSVEDLKRDASGKVYLTIRKQYNRNGFPTKEGEQNV